MLTPAPRRPRTTRTTRTPRAKDSAPASTTASTTTLRLVSNPPPQVNDPAIAASLGRPVMRLTQETFVALYINVRNALLGEPHVVAIGTVTSVEVHPRDIFREAIARNAAGVVVLHNHPSGDPTPSAEDLALTRRLRQCGELLGIPVVDHVVVTTDRHASISEICPT